MEVVGNAILFHLEWWDEIARTNRVKCRFPQLRMISITSQSDWRITQMREFHKPRFEMRFEMAGFFCGRPAPSHDCGRVESGGGNPPFVCGFSFCRAIPGWHL
jgi:hypothetical protein